MMLESKISEGGYGFLYLQARSRTPLCLPHGIEISLPTVLVNNDQKENSHYGTQKNFTNNKNLTDSVREISYIQDDINDLNFYSDEIISNMQRQSRKETFPLRKTPSVFRSASVRPPTVRFPLTRDDGGRASLRLSKDRKRISYDMSKGKLNPDSVDSSQIIRENLDLKNRLDDEENKYERRLETYRRAQQDQATLVSRLQSKLLQYKKRCTDLENQVKENQSMADIVKTYRNTPVGTSSSPLDAAQQHLRSYQLDHITDIETSLKLLNEEHNRCEKLLDLNNALREQLEEAQKTNEALTNDMQSLTTDWQQLRKEMLLKEDEWNEEEQFFDEYYTTEHNRMMNLWKDVMSMKRTFSDMQASTQRDLNKLKNDVTSASNDMVATCSGILTQATNSKLSEQEKDIENEILELQMQLRNLKNEYNLLSEQSNKKDEKIQSLTKEIKKLNEKLADTEKTMDDLSQTQTEVEILLNGLREIAQTVVSDADSKNLSIIQPVPHVHLSSVLSRSPYQDTNLKIPDTSAFVESTISGVHAALHKYQSQIHELQVKLSNQMDQLISAERQNENHVDLQQKLCKRISELNDELDSLKAEINIMNQEKESLVKCLDAIRAEKNKTDANLNEKSTALEELNREYENLMKNSNKIQKIALNLEEEKNILQTEFDRLSKELETREVNNRLMEDRYGQMLEELLSIKEELNKTYLDKDLLEQHHIEAKKLLMLAEKTKGDVESELQRVLLERSEVNDSLTKAENLVTTLEGEKNKLQSELAKMEEECIKYQNLSTEFNNDLNSVRKELLNVEQNRMDLEAEKMSLIDKCRTLESEKDQLESELSRVMNERSDLSNELVGVESKKDALNEELIRLRQRIEQVTDTNSRINKHLEDLVKDCEEKQVVLEGNEKEINHLQELNSLLKCEKDSLEITLFDIQTNLEQSEIKRDAAEKECDDLLKKQENLKVEIQNLMKDSEIMNKQANETKSQLLQDMRTKENQYKQNIEIMKAKNEESIQKITDEKNQIRVNLEKKLQQSTDSLEKEKNNEIEGMKKKLENLKQNMEIQCQQHEEAFRRAECDKQQALLIVQQDQNVLLEKLQSARTEIEEGKEMVGKVRREASVKNEQDRSIINSLRDQITKITVKLDELRTKTNEEKSKLTADIENVKKERDNYMQQSEDLKMEVNIAEDRLDNIKSQFTEIVNKQKEGEKIMESLRKEINDGRRRLNECNLEKEKYLTSNKELREFVKKSEAEKREQARTVEELNQKIAGLEDKICQLEIERSRLQNAYRDMESKILQSNQKIQTLNQELDKSNSNIIQKQNDEKELLIKLNMETEDKEAAQNDLHNYKKQLIETEANLDAYQQEVNKIRQHFKDAEERWNLQEADILSRLDESRIRERKVEAEKHNLEICLNDCNQQIQDLKEKLGGAESRVRALENQLSQLEISKRDTEQKLKSISTVFRRLGLIDCVDTGQSFRLRAARRWSPGRLRTPHDSGTDSEMVESFSEVDTDIIKKSVRSLVKQIAQIETERDDLKAEITNMKKQLDEAEDAEKKNQSRINSLIQALKQKTEEKAILESQFNQKQNALASETKAMNKKIEEIQLLKEKLHTSELNVQNFSDQKIQTEEKLSKLRHTNDELEAECQKLKNELSKTEAKIAKFEIQRISLEGDLNRLQMMLQDKDTSIQKLQNRGEHQATSISNLEERCTSLKSTIDQLNTSLELSCSGETELRQEIANLHKCLTDCSTTSNVYEDKIRQLQKCINTYENERRVLNERLERSELLLSDLQKECNTKCEQIANQQSDLDNKEIQIIGLQDQLRISKFTISSEFDEKDSVHKLQMEICELKGKNQILEERLRRLENEKKNLEHKLDIVRGRSYDKIADISDNYPSAISMTTGFNVSLLEHENRDLKDKCYRTEAQLAEKEAELSRLHARDFSRGSVERSDEFERYRAGQLHAEHLLKAREQSHRQQIEHLKNEISNLRKRLEQEQKLRKKYLTDCISDSQNVKQLRDALTDSLRTVSQNPSLDALLLDHETRKLNSSVLLAKSSIPRTRSILRK